MQTLVSTTAALIASFLPAQQIALLSYTCHHLRSVLENPQHSEARRAIFSGWHGIESEAWRQRYLSSVLESPHREQYLEELGQAILESGTAHLTRQWEVRKVTNALRVTGDFFNETVVLYQFALPAANFTGEKLYPDLTGLGEDTFAIQMGISHRYNGNRQVLLGWMEQPEWASRRLAPKWTIYSVSPGQTAVKAFILNGLGDELERLFQDFVDILVDDYERFQLNREQAISTLLPDLDELISFCSTHKRPVMERRLAKLKTLHTRTAN